MEKKVIGYTMGAFDLFHVGHLNILRNAKSMCDTLIVAVSADELIMQYKNKRPVIPFEERIEIIRSCKYCDIAIAQENLDKFEAWKKLKFDIMFVADCWFETEDWRRTESKLKEEGVKIIYFPYTKKTSSTMIRKNLGYDEQPASKEEGIVGSKIELRGFGDDSKKYL